MYFLPIDSICFFLSYQEKLPQKLKLDLLSHYLEHKPDSSAEFIHTIPLPHSIRTTLKRDIERFDFLKEKEKLHQKEVQWISLFHPLYPTHLRNSFQPPIGLFFKGNGSYLYEKKLTVVGTGQPSLYGTKIIEQCVPSLAKNNWVVVSGLAKGIDKAVHTEVIRQKGKTIAVLPCGLDISYPKEQLELQQKMMTDQLVISEYPLGSPPRKEHFPMRNRILASLSVGTIIVEAKERCSSLHIAAYALEEGREVFAFPGNVFSNTSVGTNALIKQGAKLIQTTEDIFDEFL